MKTLALAVLGVSALFGADTVRPQLVSSNPAAGQDGVNPLASVTLVFSKPIAGSSFGNYPLTFYDLTAGYNTRPFASLSQDGLTATVSLNLRIGEAYRLELNASAIKDVSGNTLVPAPPISFTTIPHPDQSAPQVVGTVPADGETKVATNTGIYLLFDRPIAPLDFSSLVTVTSAAGPVPITATAAGDRLLQITSALLWPGNQQLTVTAKGIMDRNGRVQSAPLSFSFTTGILPDGQKQSIKNQPPQAVPLAFPIHVSFSKPLDPVLLAAGSVMFQAANGSDTYLGSFSLSDDRSTLSVSAASPPPGDYTISVAIPYDRIAGKIPPFYFPVTIGSSAAGRPAQDVTVSPPDGATLVPLSAPIRLAFSGLIDLAGAPPNAVSLTANGATIPGDLTLDYSGLLLTFKPRVALTPSTTYTLSASGLNDLGGNAIPPYSFSFTTADSAPYADPFKLLSVDPASAATPIDPTSAITLTFNHPVDPVSVSPNSVQVHDLLGAVSTISSVNGAVVTVQPVYPLTGGNASVIVVNVLDLSGAVAPFQGISFSVAGAPPPAVRPMVTAVSPADGATVLYNRAHVEFAFSMPVNPATLTAMIPGTQNPANLTAFRDGITNIPVTVVSASETGVAVEFIAPPGILVTLTLSDGVTDRFGNPLVPFRTTVRTSMRPSGSGTSLLHQSPSSQSFLVSSDAPIVTFWSGPLDKASIEQNFLVFTSSGPVPGHFEWTGDARAFAFVPAAKFPDNTNVIAGLLPGARDAAGQPVTFNTSFQSAFSNSSPSGSALAFTGNNLGSSSPLNLVMDIQFNQDLPDSILQTGKATLGPYMQPAVPCPFVRVHPRILRFTPPFALAANTGYTLTFDAGQANLKGNFSFNTANFLASSTPTVVAAGPIGDSVPQNASLSILFSETVSPLGMPGAVKLLSGGVPVPLSYYWAGSQALVLSPSTFLQAATDYTVVLSGFENLAGIPIPDLTWNFRTSSAINTTPPTLLRSAPSGSNIGSDAVISFQFDEAIAPDTLAGGFRTTTPATIGLSDDLRTVFLRPTAPLAAGSTVSVSLYSFTDLERNSAQNVTDFQFQVDYQAPPPTAVTGTNPRQESTGAPLNARIQVRFDGNISLLSNIAATLAENGTPLDATLRVEADGHTLTIIPARLLSAATRIDASLTGLGPTANDSFAFGFTTGSDVDLTSPLMAAWPSGGLFPVSSTPSIHVRSNEPLSPLSVNSGTITLTNSNNALIDVGVSLDSGDQSVSVTPLYPLTPGVTYSLKCSVTDLAGNSANCGSQFTVGPPDTVLPQLIGLDPSDGTTDASVLPTIQATFNKTVDLSLGLGNFRLLLNGQPVAGTIKTSPNTIVFAPLVPLQPGATYQLMLSGVVDAFGNAVPDTTSSFTVAISGTSLTQLRLLSSLPANSAVGVPGDAPIRLTFNKPVTTASALAFAVYTYSGRIPPYSVQPKGTDVVIQPLAAIPSGTVVYISGVARDSAGTFVSVSSSYTVAPVQDTVPPTLEYSFPADGSTIPAFSTTVILRFSEPVLAYPPAIQLIGGANGSQPNWSYGQDGRTIVGILYLNPSSDPVISITSGVTDLAGNTITPLTIQLHTLSAAESNPPMVQSVTPPAGAINVPTDTLITLQFTHSIDPGSLPLGLQFASDGVPITGSFVVAPDGRSATFHPDLPFRNGAVVTVAASPLAIDTNGQKLGSFFSSFTVVKNSSGSVPALISASPTAIDVRFDGPLPTLTGGPYLRSGTTLVPSHWEVRGPDWIRILPEEPLQDPVEYRLVLDEHTDLPLHPSKVGQAVLQSVTNDATAVHLRFDGGVNPATVGPGSVQLLNQYGASVAYFIAIDVDRRGITLTPVAPAETLSINIDGNINGLESDGGVPVRRASMRAK